MALLAPLAPLVPLVRKGRPVLLAQQGRKGRLAPKGRKDRKGRPVVAVCREPLGAYGISKAAPPTTRGGRCAGLPKPGCSSRWRTPERAIG